MEIKVVQFRKDGYYSQPFAFGGEEGPGRFDPGVRYRGSLQNYLIASITSACNLHCAGCYSRYNNATVDAEPVKQLSTGEWQAIFREAEDLGVSFIMLAGGEPLLRWDVFEAAGEMKNLLFPIFTNGTYMDDTTFAQLDKCRNLIPVLSIEGDREITDARRAGASSSSTPTAARSPVRSHPIPTSTFGSWVCAARSNPRCSWRCERAACWTTTTWAAACCTSSGTGLRSSWPERPPDTKFHLIHTQLRASFPPWLSVASVNDTTASPPSAPRCQNEKTTPHSYMA